MPDEGESFSWEEIDKEITAGRMIQAIKLYREATDVGLKEAKDAVEARQDEIIPESADVPRKKVGCMGMLALAVGAIAVLARLSR